MKIKKILSVFSIGVLPLSLVACDNPFTSSKQTEQLNLSSKDEVVKFVSEKVENYTENGFFLKANTVVTVGKAQEPFDVTLNMVTVGNNFEKNYASLSFSKNHLSFGSAEAYVFNNETENGNSVMSYLSLNSSLIPKYLGQYGFTESKYDFKADLSPKLAELELSTISNYLEEFNSTLSSAMTNFTCSNNILTFTLANQDEQNITLSYANGVFSTTVNFEYEKTYSVDIKLGSLEECPFNYQTYFKNFDETKYTTDLFEFISAKEQPDDEVHIVA